MSGTLGGSIPRGAPVSRLGSGFVPVSGVSSGLCSGFVPVRGVGSGLGSGFVPVSGVDSWGIAVGQLSEFMIRSFKAQSMGILLGTSVIQFISS